jgi:raffinose/stachyose/melibiose transport system substrate-binding protein
MSRIRYLVVFLLLAAAGLSFAQQKVKLTVWIHGADSFIGPTEQQKPQSEWYISQAFKRFEQANPGVSVELVVPPDQTASHQNFNTAVLAGNAPDVANLWTGQPIYTKKQLILPIDDLVPKEDLKGIWGWESVRYNFDPKGTLLGYPAGQNQICHMLYNKAIVKKAGLDFEAAPPKTIKDFDAALAKIKATGKTPILVDEAAQGVPWFFCWVADYWWAQQTSNAQIVEQDAGKKKFVDDKGLLKTLAYYRTLYTNGYFRPDLSTANDSFTQFLQGNGAIWPAVPSFLADAEKTLGADVGILLPPEFDTTSRLKDSTIGGPGQSLVMPKNGKNPKIGVKLMSFLNSKAEYLASQKINMYPTVRTDVTIQELGWAPNSNIAKLNKYTTKYNFWVDNLLRSPGPADVFYPQTSLVAVGKMTPLQFAQEMDKSVPK